MNEKYAKAVFRDKFGVLVTVIVPYTLEHLYALYKAQEVGARISILAKAGARAIRLDLRSLSVEDTFEKPIIDSVAEEVPPVPDKDAN